MPARHRTQSYCSLHRILWRLCEINPFIKILQEPIPHVQQSLAKAAGWKIFVDLDMTNSFHQIPIDEFSSNILSVSTPCTGCKIVRPGFVIFDHPTDSITSQSFQFTKKTFINEADQLLPDQLDNGELSGSLQKLRNLFEAPPLIQFLYASLLGLYSTAD